MAGRAKLADRRGIDRVCALAVVVAGLALLAAACGGSSADPSVASLGSTASTSEGSRGSGTTSTAAAPSFVPYATCLTQHGIAASSPSGRGIAITAAVDPASPLFAAARKACQKLLPAGGQARLRGQAAR